MRILIVDDDEIACDVLEHALLRAGHEVQIARDGAAALGFLRQGVFRLVISDWEMPGMDGLELCRHIRRDELPGYVYVILLTAHDDKANVVRGLTAGADDFLSKPFDHAELTVRIRAAERILSIETRDVAIFAMAKLAESRDPDTGAHLERVRSYARLLAQDLSEQPDHSPEIDDEFVRQIYLTSPLHDIGKVGIPDSVLLKPGRLSDREFAVMKTHTTIGAETLDAAARQFPGVNYLQMARDIALTHHERFDGSGYPAGQRGNQIPMCGRITALADVYDALCSKRAYKQAFAHDIAREIIVAESGKHFDPAIVQAFIRNESAFIAIRRAAEEHAPAPC